MAFPEMGPILIWRSFFIVASTHNYLFLSSMEKTREPNMKKGEKKEMCCAYCFNSNPEQLVMCVSCKRCFCNSILVGCGSHAYLHMTLAKHFKMQTLPNSKHKGRHIRCCKCKEDNAFDLRSQSRNPSRLDNLQCLSKCIATAALKDPSFADSWHPIVDERRFADALFSRDGTPGEGAIQLTRSLISQYERITAQYPSVSITDIQLKPQQKLNPVPLNFNNSVEYFNAFEPLIKLEDAEQKLQQQNDGDKHILGRFSLEMKGRKEIPTCTFQIHQDMFSRDVTVTDRLSLTYCLFQDEMENMGRVTVNKKKKRVHIDEMDLDDLRNMQDDESSEDGDELTDLMGEMDRKNRIEYKGEVVSVDDVDRASQLVEVTLYIDRAHGPEDRLYDDGYFDVRLEDRGSVVARRLRAIQQLDEESSMHQDIWEVLMGVTRHMNETSFYLTEVEKNQNYDAPALKPLNESQRMAVVKALSQRFSLIQGPPGTGKTNTAASLIYHLVQRSRNYQYDIPINMKSCYGDREQCRLKSLKTPGKILVCVPSNVAADEICKRIHKTGVNVIRVMALSKQKDISPIQELCLHVQVDEVLMNEQSARSEDYRLLKRRVGWNNH